MPESKQFYFFDGDQWLDEHRANPKGEAHQRLLIVVNYGPSQGQCQVAWPFVDMKGKKVTLKDLMHKARYEWEVDALLYRGLYVDLLPGDFTCLHGKGRFNNPQGHHAKLLPRDHGYTMLRQNLS